ncbi:hypothetical protein V8G54_029801 [Vigna mungo]|uniref:Uncharacterized protein n=1 Tax=Vigna mungo TaxID=3915 RepID=A0AAQ3MVN9_VIGMU
MHLIPKYWSRQKEHPYLGELSVTIIIKPRRSILNCHQKNLHEKLTMNPYFICTSQQITKTYNPKNITILNTLQQINTILTYLHGRILGERCVTMSQLQRRDSKRPNIRSAQPNTIQANKKPNLNHK